MESRCSVRHCLLPKPPPLAAPRLYKRPTLQKSVSALHCQCRAPVRNCKEKLASGAGGDCRTDWLKFAFGGRSAEVGLVWREAY
jgi:hypothetical protein